MKNIKRFLIVGALVLTIGAGSLMAYADSPIRIPATRDNNFSVEERDEWFKERDAFRKDEIKRALENKEITEAEAKEWEEHFDYMEDFHNKNRSNNSGFMGRGFGGCGSGYGNGYGHGMGRGMGMMRGNSFRGY